ncbi:hypothetical protein MMC30_000365 [Trapelia coarctata]|nr:hypothetical protein [Trapelia coarctata]
MKLSTGQFHFPSRKPNRRSLTLYALLLNPKKRLSKTENHLAKTAKAAGMAGKGADVKKVAAARVTKAPAAGKPAAKAAKKNAPKGASSKAKSTSKAAAKPAHTTATATEAAAGRKRKSDDEDEGQQPPVKRVRATPAKATAPKVVINEAPKQILEVFVFGEGSAGELGLGSTGNIIDVKRPRLNPYLLPSDVGVVQIAVGGMHVAALTHDNKIITWGVNDQSALGRDTSGDVDDPTTGLRPSESTPAAVDMSVFPAGTVITQVAAGDSITLALTDEGLVYGVGTFRANEGIMGFSRDTLIQKTFALVPKVKKITKLVCGDNHVLALDQKGNVWAWGSGQQNQLGRRVVERTRMTALEPREVVLPRNRITDIASGTNHSFAIDNSGKVWSWGLNSYGQTGQPEKAGEDDASVVNPRIVKSLEGKDITSIAGGHTHSLAVTAEGECLVWGRLDGCQSGLKVADLLEENVIVDENEIRRILTVPTTLKNIGKAAYAAAGADYSVVVNQAGRACSWGYSANYQTGQGSMDDIDEPELIDNTATRQKKLVWAGCGGQFAMLASEAA